MKVPCDNLNLSGQKAASILFDVCEHPVFCCYCNWLLETCPPFDKNTSCPFSKAQKDVFGGIVQI